MRAIVMLCMLGTALAQDGVYSWNGPLNKVENTTDNVCLMDTGSCSCCLMQRKMYRLKNLFNETINEIQDNLMKAQTVLKYIHSSQYAFSVALTNTRRCVGPYRVDTILMYKHVFTNLGDVYKPSTGVFTAPRSGIYFLALTVYSDAGTPNAALLACAKLMRNMVVEVSLTERNNEDQEDSISTSLLLNLQAGDNVYVQLPTGCFLCDNSNHYNTFTGYLVYPTD